MKTFSIAAVAAAASTLAVAAPALAQVNYDEAVDGDTSNDGFNTTDLGTLALGSNSITGSMGSDFDFDPDYFSFTIGAGQELAAINLSFYEANIPGDQASFIAIQAGNQVTSEFDTSVFLGATLIGNPEIGTDILDDTVVTPLFGGQGATPPLGAGTYSIWWQETGHLVDYSFEFVVVPAPGAMTAMLGAGLIAARRRRA